MIQNENQGFKMMLKIFTFRLGLQNYDHKIMIACDHDFVNKVET